MSRAAMFRSAGGLSRCLFSRQLQPWRCRLLDTGARLLLHKRDLATAVSDFSASPYDHLVNTALPAFPPPSSGIYERQPFDPLMLESIPEPGVPMAATKMNRYGIPGETESMLLVFDACIDVGRLERAAAVLKRFNSMAILSLEERISLHNQYLRTSLLQMQTSPDRRQAEQLHKWYELQIRSKGLPHTAETIACMLKASLLSERGPRLERLVKRYMGMAPGSSGLQVLTRADILSDQDLAVITNFCPAHTFTKEAEEVDFQDFDEIEPEIGDIETKATEAATESDKNPASSAIPELMATPQRGEGLAFLKQGLRALMDSQDVDISKLSDAARRDFQLQVERDAIGNAVDRWRSINKDLRKMGINAATAPSSKTGSLSQHMGDWLVALEKRLKEEMALIPESENKTTKNEQDLERCVYGPLLEQSNPARLAAVTIMSVLSVGAMQGMDKGIVVSHLVSNVAKLVQEDIEMQKGALEKVRARKEKKLRRGVALAKPVSEPEVTQSTTDEPPLIEVSSETLQKLETMRKEPWSMFIRARVGSILLKLFLETAKIQVSVKHSVTNETVRQSQPAFAHMLQPRRGKKIGVLIPNMRLMDQMKREPIGDFIAKHLPMIVEPKPWRHLTEGGFLESKSTLVRISPGDEEQKLYTNAAIESGNLKQVFQGLDALGKTAWQINKNVLTVMMEAWNSGEEIANMPPLDPDLEVPEEPDSSADPLLRKRWIRAVKAVENKRYGLHSQRCYMNLQLEIARTFRNQTIYFPHNLDYRGRAYPMPTYLNHMGADHARAILKFANGKMLGARGLQWLKIHLANLYGMDKSSFEEREAFTDKNVPNIIDSATRPLDGTRWWLKAEDPWQCLAACFELKAALDLPDPTQFVSQLPVHQDGTCNGLQHYAALGGDTWGARQVNLEPGDRPADVYSAVANLVKEGIDEDAKAQVRPALVLQGKITRKVVKQTVMTNVYGVTFSGAKKQVCKQIEALYPDLGKECGIPNMILSTYIAKHIFRALKSMFGGAHDIQYWLGEIGNRVCRALTASQLQQIADGAASAEAKSGRPSKNQKTNLDELAQHFRSTVVWTTPLRLPVAQPYRKHKMREIRTCLQAISYPINDRTNSVDRRKQLQGFPPNFIHSLDASHMLLSALQCSDQGLDFAAVHDSFWTHAADVDTMNGILREAFIRIHEEDVIGRLAKEVQARHKGSLYLSHIEPDSAVAEKIKELRKKNKLSLKDELLLEHRRNSLRLSGDPQDLAAAQKMVTPASIYEEMAGRSAEVRIDPDMSDTVLGEIPATEVDELHRVTGVDQTLSAVDDESPDPLDQDSPRALSDRLLEKMNTAYIESYLTKKQKPAKYKKLPVPVWLPLTIPDVPKKVRLILCSDA